MPVSSLSKRSFNLSGPVAQVPNPAVATAAALAPNVATSGWVANVFVSPSGSDSNNGLSAASPKLTLTAAMNLATAGQTISLANGSYVGNFSTTKGGTAGNPITIRAANKHLATLEGFIRSIHQYVIWRDLDFQRPAGRSGLGVEVNNTSVINCKFHNICKFDPGSDGASALTVVDPASYDTVMSNILIDGCEVYDIGEGVGLNGTVQGLYVSNPVTAGTGIISNNLCYGVCDFGIHAFHNPNNWIYVNNTVVGCGRGILQGPNGITRNNISYNNQSWNYDIRGTGNVLSNNFSGGDGEDQAYGGVTQGVNPLFVNGVVNTSGTGDFRLQSGSTCRNAGTLTNAPPIDITGASRPIGAAVDCGCYEMG